MRTLLRQLLPAAVLLGGCESQITVDLTDGPTDGAQEVVLDITHVALLTEGGQVVRMALDDPGPVDLLAFRNGETYRLVGDETIDPGTYTGIALDFAAGGSFVTLEDGSEAVINTPVTRDFADIDLVIGELDNERVVMDLNLRFSLVDTGAGTYDLEPVWRAVLPAEAGAASGSVSSAIVEGTACRQGRPIGRGVAVYAFRGSSVTPNDYVGQASLVDADDVESDGASGYQYELHHLPPGSYTLALTCEADEDDPATDDAVVFTATGNVSVTAGGTASLDFL